ncbi:MAG: hypothetical protein SF162_07195 [bacterium]|nr:hypothetical protein [bacterium]
MPLLTVTGDPLLTRAHVLGFAHNRRGRQEVTALHTRLAAFSPPAFATFARRARQGQFKPGDLWLWRDSRPALGFMVVRETPFGATRARYVEAVALRLARDHRLEGIASIALIAPGDSFEWRVVQPVLERWLGKASLPVIVYTQVIAGVQADESALLG